MALVCSISNEVPEDPVLSAVSNHVFEKRLILKYVQQTGLDPVNGKPLNEDQLIEIKVDPLIKARPPSATSIPAVLKLLQDEWDACMLHSFTLRQQLQTARQELSHALYQHDAACRVIARLTKEATAAREALATLKPQATGYTPHLPEQAPADFTRTTQEAMETEPAAEMTENILQKLQDTAALLTAERKKRGKKVPEGLTTIEEISNFQQLSTHPGLHSAGTPGILALDLSGDSGRALTGGVDKNAVVFDKNTEQIVATLKGHSKKVTSVIYHPQEDVAITSSPDSTIRIWSIETSSSLQTVRVHEGPVTGISLHATGDYLLSSSSDRSWGFLDIHTGRLVSKGNDADSSAALTCAQFHPDGLIFGTGTANSVVKIWDLKERANVANFPGHVGQITNIAFSENGYYLATAAEDSVVKLWDLRKLKNFKTLELEQDYQMIWGQCHLGVGTSHKLSIVTCGGCGGPHHVLPYEEIEIQCLCFDQSGTYLAVGGTDIQVYLCKQWNLLKTFTDHTGLATGVRFGKNTSFLASVSMDRNLKYYGI